jgi:putative membrane protein
MIVRPRPGILLLFFITRGSIVPKIAPQVLAITTLSVAVVGGARLYPGSFPAFTLAPFSILGLALSIFLGFRNNACYDRWWEARRQWGQLIVETRSLARETLCLLGEADAEEDALRRRIVRRGIAFAAALAARLRRDAADLSAWLDPREAAEVKSKRNIPEAILRLQAADLARCRRTGRLSDILFQMLAMRLAAMAGIQAACERIATTPLPFAYTLLVHRTAYLFCLLLPFGLVATLGWATPLVAAITAYTFFGLDALGDELEEPFGGSENGLPLAALVRVIEISLLEAAGESELPEPLQPVGHVLR